MARDGRLGEVSLKLTFHVWLPHLFTDFVFIAWNYRLCELCHGKTVDEQYFCEMDSQTNLQQRFLCIRRRLEQLGYRQVFGIESLLLVEQLFVDLLHVTEELNSTRQQLKRQGIGQSNEPDCVSLIQADFLRLTRENADLHEQIAQLKENSTATVRDVKAKLRKLENENSDVKFLNNQYLHKINQLEKDACVKSQRIRELHEKSPQAVVHSQAGERKRQTVYRRQQMEIKSQLAPSPDRGISDPKRNLEEIDSMKVAEQRISTLQARIESMLKCQEGTDAMCETLKKQLAVRTEEVDRLSKLIIAIKKCSHRGYSEPLQKHSDETIEKLNAQMGEMQGVNQELEKRLKEALNNTKESAARAANAIEEKERVERELRKERDEKINKFPQYADSKEQKSKEDLDKSYLELEGLINENEKLQTERLQMLTEKSALTTELSQKVKELAETVICLNTARNENANLMDAVARCKANEDTLGKEIERLSELLQKPGSVPGNVERVVQAVERQRDYYKSRLMASKDAKTTGDDNAVVKHIEDERDFYKREYQYFKRQHPTEQSNSDSVNIEEKIGQLMDERDELQQALERLEKHVEEMDATLRKVSADRDRLDKLHQDLENGRGKNTVVDRIILPQINFETGNLSSSLDAAAVYKAELERDRARADLQNIVLARDDLRKRLQMATESQIADRKRFEKKFSDLESELIRVGRERSEVSAQVGSYKVLLASVEDQVKALESRVREADSQIAHYKSLAADVRRQAEDSEKSLRETQQLLKQKVADGMNSGQKISDLERKIEELKDAFRKQNDNVASLQSSLKMLDRDRDMLQMEFDSKTEKLVKSENQNEQMGKDIYDLRLTVSSMEVHIKQLSEDLRDRNQDVKAIRRQLESVNNELSVAVMLRDQLMRDNKQITNDLAVMTREHQNLVQDLQTVCRERDSLKRQIQDYVSEVSRIEELLKAKEQDQSHILSQFHNLTMATSTLESHSSELEIQASNAQLEILAKDAEIKYAHDTIAVLNEEVQQLISAQQSRENDAINLHDSLARMENKLQSATEDLEKLRRELTVTRDLCLKVNREKEEISQDLNAKTREGERMVAHIAGLQDEVTELHDRMSAEKSKVQRLEQVLAENRQKEYQINVGSQGLEAELMSVKSKLTDAERKLVEQEMTGNRYRLNVAELEMESERLRHQLTDERFQKERVAQEARRFRSSPGIETFSSSQLNVLHGSSTSSNSPRIIVDTDRPDMVQIISSASGLSRSTGQPTTIQYSGKSGLSPQDVQYPRPNV